MYERLRTVLRPNGQYAEIDQWVREMLAACGYWHAFAACLEVEPDNVPAAIDRFLNDVLREEIGINDLVAC